MLAFLLAGVLFPAQLDVYAAGAVTVKIADIDGLGADFPGFNFKLYEVGGYDGPRFVLDPEYADSGVTLPEYDEENPEPDQEAWLSAAESLANYIKHNDGSDPVSTFENIKPGEEISYYSDNTSLFLLVGETVRYDNQYYTPSPIFVRTFKDSETYTIDGMLKIKIEPVVFKHSLKKTWDDEGYSDVRPTAIEIGIYYGDQLIDSVMLGGEEGKWTYTWTSEEAGDTYCYISEDQERIEFEPGTGDQGWGVREFITANEMTSSEAIAEADKMLNYSPEYSKTSSEDMEAFTINNPYNKPPTPTPPQPPEPGKKVKTGDESRLGLWVGIAGAACVLLIAFLLIRRKRKDVEE